MKNVYKLTCNYSTGTPALTTRGLKEADIDRVVDFIDKALKLGQEITKISGPKIVDFNKTVDENADINKKVADLRGEVEKYSATFQLPGYETY